MKFGESYALLYSDFLLRNGNFEDSGQSLNAVKDTIPQFIGNEVIDMQDLECEIPGAHKTSEIIR